MIIRAIDKTEIDLVAVLWLKMVKELDSTLNPNVEWWKAHVYEFLKYDYFMLVAEIDKKIVGFIDFIMFAEPTTSKFHCIGQHFYVLSEYRNSSVAGRLYKAVVKLSKKFGAQHWELFCSKNELPMWKKLGYQQRKFILCK